MLRGKNIVQVPIAKMSKVAFGDVTIGASQASNPTKTDCTCLPKTNPKKPRSR